MIASEPDLGASTALARAIAPALLGDGRERPITVDQTNRSVVVDESVIVKWFRPPRSLPHRGIEVLTHLAEVGFDSMPAFHGSHIENGHVVASVASFLPGARDGWAWYLDEVHAWYDGSLDRSALIGRARALGSLAGRLHVALATPSARWPNPVGEVSIRQLHVRAVALLETARKVTGGATAEHLEARWESIRAELDVLDTKRNTAAITVHGDLHVGNVLAIGGQLAITDFDGNPIADSADDGLQQPAAVDVAALLQSIDHVVRIVDHRTAGARRADLTRLIDELVGAALDTYRAELTTGSLDRLLDVTLLRPLRVAQELHELAYAAAHLPHWVYVPDAALTSMFPLDSEE